MKTKTNAPATAGIPSRGVLGITGPAWLRSSGHMTLSMNCSRFSVCLALLILSLGLGCSHSRSVGEPVQVELRTLDGKVGYATGRDAVLQCVMVNDVANLKRLIAEGQDIKTPLKGETTRAWTFLHFAALQGHANAAELLIQSGADVNAKSRDGVTPLKIARENKRSDVVDVLEKHGAK